MNIVPNIESIKIPLNPSREWIWYRILISIDYYTLKKPTALQWALLKVLLNLDKIKGEASTEKVASKLAVEKTIIDEGINNLIDEKLISLLPRKNPDILQNYVVGETVQEMFAEGEFVISSRENKKIILFYDYKDERIYNYQTVERTDDEREEETDNSVFELLLLAIIETIWKELENNPHSFTGEIEFPTVLEHRLVKGLQSIKIENVHLNFL